jgi:hypothetical protein
MATKMIEVALCSRHAYLPTLIFGLTLAGSLFIRFRSCSENARSLSTRNNLNFNTANINYSGESSFPALTYSSDRSKQKTVELPKTQ